MVRQIKATSIKSSPLCEEKHEWASACEPRSQGSRARENRVTPFTGAATERHQSENAQRFLLDLSAEFVSRDYETTLKRLAIRTVPFLADFCFFDVLSANGTMQRVSWAHADTLKRPLLDVAVEFVPDRSSMNHPVSNVMRTGQSEFAPEINDAWMSAVATSPRHLALMRDLELRSLIAVPLLVPGLTLGVLTFCYAASSGRHYCREDLWLAEDLAHRTAIVVENARLYHELQDASHRKDEFLAMLGHELRNPLAPIRNAMQILGVKSASAPELQELAALVERQIQQLTRLVDDLLEVSRVGHGKINLQMQPVDLKTVVALAIESSRPLIDARKHVLKDSLPQQAVEVQGDPGRLVQVVSNLLNNSAKYSDDGGQIELNLQTVGDQAVLRLRDNGIGIAPSMLPRIFDLFSQVKGSASRSEAGLGIGLALVRNMIELHGGYVHAASAGLGHGAEFVVRLPLMQSASAGTSLPQHRPSSPANAPTRRILLVDDNRDAADSMALLLRLAGHDVRIAYDGQTALAMARLQSPEVVICDISMPGMCGLELARRLRQDVGLENALLVALSGYAQEKDRHRSQDAGFNVHFCKPARLDNLKEALASNDFVTAAGPGPYKAPISVTSTGFQT